MKNNPSNGLTKAPSNLKKDVQRERWETSYHLLRDRMNLSDEEARKFAQDDVELLDEIDRELSLVEA